MGGVDVVDAHGGEIVRGRRAGDVGGQQGRHRRQLLEQARVVHGGEGRRVQEVAVVEVVVVELVAAEGGHQTDHAVIGLVVEETTVGLRISASRRVQPRLQLGHQPVADRRRQVIAPQRFRQVHELGIPGHCLPGEVGVGGIGRKALHVRLEVCDEFRAGGFVQAAQVVGRRRRLLRGVPGHRRRQTQPEFAVDALVGSQLAVLGGVRRLVGHGGHQGGRPVCGSPLDGGGDLLVTDLPRRSGRGHGMDLVQQVRLRHPVGDGGPRRCLSLGELQLGGPGTGVGGQGEVVGQRGGFQGHRPRCGEGDLGGTLGQRDAAHGPG